MTQGRAASIHARLLETARFRGEDFNHVLNRYAVERFLYRLSVSDARDRYWLKGALLFDVWFDLPHRPTRDVDLLGFGSNEATILTETVRSLCAIDVDDGMLFDADSVESEVIREQARYGGLRVKLRGRLGNARCHVQIDVGFGDAVTPGPEEIVYPQLLTDQPAPHLQAYPRATVFAEKVEAIVNLGIANSRMKDYFDLRALAQEGVLEPDPLASAIAATFARRKTAIPAELPLGLTDTFAQDAAKRTQWKAFLAKNRLQAPTLDDVVSELRDFLTEPLRLARVRAVKAARMTL